MLKTYYPQPDPFPLEATKGGTLKRSVPIYAKNSVPMERS